MSEGQAPRSERFTTSQLVIAAAALAAIGFVLLIGSRGDGDPSAATTPTSQQDAPDAAPSGDQPEATDVVTSTPTDGPDDATPPPLPSGIQRPGPTQAPDPATVDRSSPSKIAIAAVTAAYSMDTATDDDPYDALARVAPWLGEPHDSDAYDLDDLGDLVADDWDTWTEHDAYASINVIQDVISNDAVSPEARGDTATEAMRKVAVSFTPLGRDGWNGSVADHTWYVHLGRGSESDGWQIVEMRRPEFAPTAPPLPTSLPTASPT